jgi:hypothetical protein
MVAVNILINNLGQPKRGDPKHWAFNGRLITLHQSSPRWPGSVPSSVRVGFVVHKVTLGQVLLPVLGFSSVSIIPPLFHIHSCITRGTNNRPASSRSSARVSPHRNNSNNTRQVFSETKLTTKPVNWTGSL